MSSQNYNAALWGFQLLLSLVDISIAALLAVWTIDLPALVALSNALRLKSESTDISGLTALGALSILWMIVSSILVALSTAIFFGKPSIQAAKRPVLGPTTLCYLALSVLAVILVARLITGVVAVCEVLQISALATSFGLRSPFTFPHRLVIALVWALSLFISLWTMLAQVVWFRHALNSQEQADDGTSSLMEKKPFDLEETVKVDSRDRVAIPEGYLSARRKAAGQQDARSAPPPSYTDAINS